MHRRGDNPPVSPCSRPQQQTGSVELITQPSFSKHTQEAKDSKVNCRLSPTVASVALLPLRSQVPAHHDSQELSVCFGLAIHRNLKHSGGTEGAELLERCSL